MLPPGPGLPQLRPLVPWRIMLDGAAFAAGGAAAARWMYDHRLPRARRRRLGRIAALVALVLVPTSLVSLGAEHETRSTAYYDRLLGTFTAMERQVSAFKATQSYLDQQIKMWTAGK